MKQKEGMAAMEAQAPAQPQLDSRTVLATLYERITRDCHDAQNYLSITDIIGCLETIKLSIFQATHIAVAQKVSNEITKGKTVN